MSALNLAGNLLPLIVFLISFSLAVFARLKKWDATESVSAEESARDELPAAESVKETVRGFVARFRWEIVLASVIAGLVTYAILFAPPRLTGEIPPEINMPGRPFYSLSWQRAFFTKHYEIIGAVGLSLAGLLCAWLITIAIRTRSRRHTEAGLLFASLTLAAMAQWVLGNPEIKSAGAPLYLLALSGFLYWAWIARARNPLEIAPSYSRKSFELPILLILLTLTAFGRFYALGSVPYGIEGDEAKWTSEAVNLQILGEQDVSGAYHRDALPMSFYLQTPLHRIFGPSLLAARATVALLSVLASLSFYWLLRQLAPFGLAALATFLLSVSIFDISASRLANVESFVKIGAVLPLALLAYALRDKKPWPVFAVSGLAIGLGALIYDTLWPITGVALVLVIWEMRAQKYPAQQQVKNISAMLAPILLTMPLIIPYFVSRISYYQLSQKGFETGLLTRLWEHFLKILETWFVILRPDFLYNRNGPLLNAALLPFLVVGVAVTLFAVRARSAKWMIVWAALVIFPVPMITNSPLGRVYYPALPAVYGLAAIGLFLIWQELNRVVHPTYQPVLVMFALVAMFWLPLFNYYIYFNEVADPTDRLARREISEIAASAAERHSLLLLASVPNADEPLNNEHQMIELFMLSHLPYERVRESYRRIALDQILPSVADGFSDWRRIIVVQDKLSAGQAEQRRALTESLQFCFPRAEFISGRFFDQIVLDAESRREPTCTPVNLSLRASTPPSLHWEISAGNPSGLNLVCHLQRQDFLRIEAETIPLAAGWQIQINFAPGWTGNGFLMDNYGSAFLGYNFDGGFGGPNLYFWIRTYKRAVDNSPAYLVLGQTSRPFAATPPASLNQWIWERVGPFPNSTDLTQMVLFRPYEESVARFMAIFIDTIMVTDDPAFHPEISLTTEMPSAHYDLRGKASQGDVTLDFLPGRYSCRLELDSSEAFVDAFGRTPVQSNEVEFEIK